MSTSCEFVRIRNTYHEILPLRSNQNKDTHVHNQLQKLFVQSFILTLVYKVWIEKWVFDACRRQTVAFDWTVIYVFYLATDLDLALYWYDECWLTSKASLNNLKNIKSKSINTDLLQVYQCTSKEKCPIVINCKILKFHRDQKKLSRCCL